MMARIFIIFILFISASFSVFAGKTDCDEVQINAQQEQDRIPFDESNYKVTSKSRLYFYSAPNEKCKLNDLFIVKGDLVNAYSVYGDFISIMYFQKNGNSINGWVKLNGVAPVSK